MEGRNTLAEALTAIAGERRRQDEKWGDQVPAWPVPNYDLMMAILVEEVGEVAKALLEGGDVKEELTHVGAVAAKWYEIELYREEYYARPDVQARMAEAEALFGEDR